jgi:MFS family permease
VISTELPHIKETWRDWMVVVTSTIALSFSVMHVYSMGMFILPIEAELGWSRGEIAGGLTAVSIVSVVLSPFIGLMIDRFGSRRISIFGIVAFCAAIATVSTTGPSIWNWWLLWGGVALGAVFIKPTVWMSAIAGRFTRRRGLAMGVAYCGLGLGSATMPLLSNMLIGAWGWRAGYVALAALAFAVSLPMILLFFRDAPSIESAADRRAALPGVSIAEGFRSTRYWRIAASAFLAACATIGITVHFVPILASFSMSRSEAAAIAGAIGISSIAGRILTGYLLDHIRGNLIGAVAFGLPILACVWLLSFDGSRLSAIGIAAIIGFSLGAETDIIGYLTTRYFGLRNYGVLFGTIVGLLTCAAGVGPAIAGVIYDNYGNYEPMIWAMMPTFALCAILMASLGDYPKWVDRPVSHPGENG